MSTEELILVATAVSTFMGIASVLAVPAMLVRMPADYFKHPKPHLLQRLRAAPTSKCLVILAKNVLGLVLAAAGIAMLVLPGQGLLTILVALLLLDLPRKHDLEQKIVRRPKVRQAIDWLRTRKGQPPLEL